MMGDVDAAIEDVVNDSISNLEDEKPVVLDLDNVSLGNKCEEAINEEFNNILSILDFNSKETKTILDDGILMDESTFIRLLILITRKKD